MALRFINAVQGPLVAAIMGVGGLLSPGLAAPNMPPSEQDCASAWHTALERGTAEAFLAFRDRFASCNEVVFADAQLRALRRERETRGRLFGDKGTPNTDPVGKLLAFDAPLQSVNGGHATIALRNTGVKEQALCDVFTRKIGPFEPAARNPAADYGRPVYWPLKRHVSVRSVKTCGAMLEAYDFTRGLRQIDDMRRLLAARGSDQAARLMGRGPFVIMWREGGLGGGVFDFSDVPTDELVQQIDAFLLYASLEVNEWDKEHYEEANIRQWIRNYLQTAGRPLTTNIAHIFGLPTAAHAMPMPADREQRP
ncbi:MAG: hypothetical protein ACFB6R_11125 [Alphaproteobacteria bacterium]